MVYNQEKPQEVYTMLFLQYPPCSTCKKAKSWLDARGVSYTDRHIKENNPSYEELKAWYERSGLPLKRFFNTSGLAYKSLNLKERLPGMSEEEQLRLLASDGMLVKRPLLITDSAVLPGFKEAQWAEVIED
jgi:arsenate reductase